MALLNGVGQHIAEGEEEEICVIYGKSKNQ
jgi:hypothetical protein